MQKFLEEIKRRNVFKVAVVYIIAGWLTMQVVDVMFPALNIPGWFTSAIAALVIIGFPFALIFAWAFELTPEGIKREKDVDRSASIAGQTGRKLNTTIILILAVALGFMLVDKFWLSGPLTHEAAPANIKPSIAVLPFVNMSGDQDNEYFSDGLSEELLNLLAKIPHLHVAGRTSSFRFKGTNEDLRLIGEMLNVANVLEGSVRQSGTQLRITAQLINAETGYHLWSETYDRELTDIFAIQDEIAASVVAALRLTLLGDEIPAPSHGTDNIEAYNLYLRARYLTDQTTEADFLNGIEALERAVGIDPEFADAYALLAETYQLLVSGFVGDGLKDFGDFEAGFRRVHEYADRALAIDPDNAGALYAKAGAVWVSEYDLATAAELYAQALDKDPNHTGAIGWLSFLRLVQGHHAESIALAQRALELDPLSIANLRAVGDAYRAAGRSDEARAIYQSALELQPDTARIYGRLARIALASGDFVTAATLARREPVEWERDMLAVMINGGGNDSEAYQAAVQAYADTYGDANSYQLAEMYGFVGDVENTFKWLQRGVDVRDPGLPWSGVSEFLVSVQDDPRWVHIMEQIGLGSETPDSG